MKVGHETGTDTVRNQVRQRHEDNGQGTPGCPDPRSGPVDVHGLARSSGSRPRPEPGRPPEGTMVTSGEMKIASRNSTPVTMFAETGAPAPIPVADSTKIWLAERMHHHQQRNRKRVHSEDLVVSSTLPSFMVPASAAKTKRPSAFEEHGQQNGEHQ